MAPKQGKTNRSPASSSTISGIWARLFGRGQSFYRRPLTWVAGLAVLALGGLIQDQFNHQFSHLGLAIEDRYCEWREGVPAPAPDKLTVLLARLDNDPDGANWDKVRNAFLVNGLETFQVYPLCKSFSFPKYVDFETAEKQMLSRATAEVKRDAGDVLIFGNASGDGLINLWFAGQFGGCSDPSTSLKPTPIKLGDEKSTGSLSVAAQSNLLGAASQEIMAACNNRDTADWPSVAAKVDQIAAFVAAAGTQLSEPDRNDVLIKIYALSLDRFARVGEQPWYNRANAALTTLLESSQIKAKFDAANILRMGWIALESYQYQFSKSVDALSRGLAIYRSAKEEALKNAQAKFIVAFGDQIILLLQESAAKGLATDAEVAEAKAASAPQ